MTTTIFTWGYYGWGSATPQLLEVVDALERARGFRPPLFVDIRLRRAVRAKGFQGSAFEKLLGPDRHRWMQSLGNRFIETRSGPGIQIAEPAAARELLDLAVDRAGQTQRLLFFCSCQYPRDGGQTACHRDTVADLVLDAARQSARPVTVVEWPGGEPQQVTLDVTPEMFKALERGRVTVPLVGESVSPWVRCLPWGSVVTVRGAGRGMRVLSGPAMYQKGGWCLPVFGTFPIPGATPEEIEQAAAKLRASWGLEGRSSGEPAGQDWPALARRWRAGEDVHALAREAGMDWGRLYRALVERGLLPRH